MGPIHYNTSTKFTLFHQLQYLNSVPMLDRTNSHHNVTADIIILGCSLPGIVAAHNLKKKFGDSMDIVVLDLCGDMPPRQSRQNVSFHIEVSEKEKDDNPATTDFIKLAEDYSINQYYLLKYANEFKVEIPDSIIFPKSDDINRRSKLFQFKNGSFSECWDDYHSFKFVNIFERFELSQFQLSLNDSMRSIYVQANTLKHADRLQLLYFDSTSMETYIRQCLFVETSREIMRTAVRIVCGVSSDKVSVLFYLHQSYRQNGVDNLLDNSNTLLRERVLAFCRKKLVSKLLESVADITQTTKPIWQIRTYTDRQVILETLKGETNYVCTLLALALRPEQLHDIRMDSRLLSHRTDIEPVLDMDSNHSKRFAIQYRENFWKIQGYSGDIFSLKGPIIWAMELPKLSGTGSKQRYPTIVGYLNVTKEEDQLNSKEAVLAQLVKLFGDEATNPVDYKETDFIDLYVPRCGDYVGLQRLTETEGSRGLEWSALDVFGEGDLSAALEAGHRAYLHVVNQLRPQASSYTELSSAEWLHILPRFPVTRYFSYLNYISGAKMIVVGGCIYLSYYGVKKAMKYITWLFFKRYLNRLLTRQAP